MKVVVDAQLPFGLAILFRKLGWDALHTNNLPNGDVSTDEEIRTFCEAESRILITKDADFVDSFYVRKSPKKLLIVSTGNIKNSELYSIFEKNRSQIETHFLKANLLEITRSDLVIHE